MRQLRRAIGTCVLRRNTLDGGIHGQAGRCCLDVCVALNAPGAR
jgi:hypothetical protein